MGYLQKNSVICNPAKKNGVNFQWSYSERYVSGYRPSYGTVRVDRNQTNINAATFTNRGNVTVSIATGESTMYGFDSYTLAPGQSIEKGMQYSRVMYNGSSYDFNYSYSVQTGSTPIYSTRTLWKTNWSKR